MDNASLARPTDRSRPEALPDAVETPTAKLVYLALDVGGPATVDDLQAALGLKKLVLFQTLDALAARGLAAVEDRRWAAA